MGKVSNDLSRPKINWSRFSISSAKAELEELRICLLFLAPRGKAKHRQGLSVSAIESKFLKMCLGCIVAGRERAHIYPSGQTAALSLPEESGVKTLALYLLQFQKVLIYGIHFTTTNYF